MVVVWLGDGSGRITWQRALTARLEDLDGSLTGNLAMKSLLVVEVRVGEEVGNGEYLGVWATMYLRGGGCHSRFLAVLVDVPMKILARTSPEDLDEHKELTLLVTDTPRKRGHMREVAWRSMRKYGSNRTPREA